MNPPPDSLPNGGLRQRLVSACLAAGLALAAAPLQAETIRLGGTGSALAAMTRMGEALSAKAPGLQVAVMPSLGSSGGLRALQQARLDAAVVSRPLTEAEKAAGLVATPYARTALVFATRHAAARDLTEDDLVAILSGQRAAWPDGTPLRLVLRPASDTDSALLDTLSPRVAAAHAAAHRREGILVGTTDQESADFIERVPGAIGTATLSLLAAESRPVRSLRLGGVAPSAESVANGRYPLVKTFYFVTRGPPAGALARLVAYCLSSEGARLLASTGHAPVR